MRPEEGRRRRIATLLVLALAALAQGLARARANPIVGGYLSPWEVPLRHRHQASLMRDPMPWEDGYFDPTYHAWPKSRRQQVADKPAAGKPEAVAAPADAGQV